MSTDFSIKPVGAPVATPIVHPVSADAVGASVSRQVVVDRAAAAIVYQVVDTRTSLVVDQFPDEAVLRRRAYFHTLDLTKSAPTRLVTDRKA